MFIGSDPLTDPKLQTEQLAAVAKLAADGFSLRVPAHGAAVARLTLS